MSFTEQIRLKLEQALPGSRVEVEDQSDSHIEHNPTGAHITVKLKYQVFKDKTRVDLHQMIYNVLRDEMKEKIHALKIEAKVE